MRDHGNARGNDSTNATNAGRPGLSRRRFIQTASVMALQAAFVPALSSCTGQSPVSRQKSAQADNGSVASKLAKLEKMSGTERQQFLEEQAAKEGSVVMYSGSDPVLLREWQKAFMKRYPKVEARFQRMTGSQGLQKVTTESQTGRATASLFHTNTANLAVVLDSKLAAKYTSPESKDFDAAYVDKDGYWAVEWLDKYIIGFNTERVKKSEIPRDVESLTDPKWKGKLAFPSPGGPGLVATMQDQMGKARGTAFLKKLAAQDIRIYDSNTETGNALTSGQVALAFNFLLNDAAIRKQQGAPVDYLVSKPTVMNAGYQLILSDAPHPYAAALAYDWILSKEGQELVPKFLFLSPRDDVKQVAVQLDTQREAERLNAVAHQQPSMFVPGNPYTEMFNDLFVRR